MHRCCTEDAPSRAVCYRAPLQAMSAFQGFPVTAVPKCGMFCQTSCNIRDTKLPLVASRGPHRDATGIDFPSSQHCVSSALSLGDPPDSGIDVLLNATVAPTTKLPQSRLCYTSGQGMWGRGVKTGSAHSAPCKDWLRAKSPASSAACATSSASAAMWACTAAAGQTWLGSRPALPAQKLKVWGSPSCSKA